MLCESFFFSSAVLFELFYPSPYKLGAFRGFYDCYTFPDLPDRPEIIEAIEEGIIRYL